MVLPLTFLLPDTIAAIFQFHLPLSFRRGWIRIRRWYRDTIAIIRWNPCIPSVSILHTLHPILVIPPLLLLLLLERLKFHKCFSHLVQFHPERIIPLLPLSLSA